MGGTTCELIDSNNAAPAERSDKQREAARINGAKSHRPVTPDGKRNSSLNALRHNFCSESLVLNNEQKPRYQALLDSYLETFRPSGLVETDLVEQMAAAKWREQRAWTLQCATLDYSMDAMRPRLAATIQSTDRPPAPPSPSPTVPIIPTPSGSCTATRLATPALGASP